MLAEKIKDRIRLLEIVDSFGETGASFERIGKEWWACTKGGSLDLRTFHRYRRDIEDIFGVGSSADAPAAHRHITSRIKARVLTTGSA